VVLHGTVSNPSPNFNRIFGSLDPLLLYGDFPLVENPHFADFHVRMEMSKGLRRHFFFSIDDEIPFSPLPFDEAVAMLEWCLTGALRVGHISI
jgi:hypothetical protein